MQARHSNIETFDSTSGMNVELDTSLAHPWCSEISPTLAKKDGADAQRREESKRTRYGKKRLPRSASITIKL